MRKLLDRPTLSWALYDWANSAYATVVVAGFFPIFFREYWSADQVSEATTFRLGVGTSIASLIILVLAPILGAIADRASLKKKMLFVFAYVGVLSTVGLFLVAQGNWVLALFLYVVASIGFSGGNVFYDALLLDVAPTEDRIHMVSGLGFALGYLGGGVLFAFNVFMVLQPEMFGFADAGEAVRISFIMVAIWWAIFSIPILLFVEEAKPERNSTEGTIIGAFIQLSKTFKEIKKNRVILLFLLAYWFYIDGVDTIFRMAVDYGLAIGLDSNDLITALLLVQFIGFPAAIVFGKLGQKFGPKTGIYIGIFVYTVATIWAYFMTTGLEFYLLAGLVGLVIGGIQALSRSMFGQMIPLDQAGEYYGFFNMIGKSAAVIGPFLVGWTTVAFGTRNSILSVLVLFAVGGLILYFVPTPRNSR